MQLNVSIDKKTLECRQSLVRFGIDESVVGLATLIYVLRAHFIMDQDEIENTVKKYVENMVGSIHSHYAKEGVNLLRERIESVRKAVDALCKDVGICVNGYKITSKVIEGDSVEQMG